VIGLGDTPGVPTSAWEALRVADADVAVASFGGQLRPPVKLSAARYPEVPTEGDVGARVLWHRPGTLEVPCDGDPSDIDTLDDLARLEAAT
jgi:molybdenum cofactor cytidylyltransferase